jgi:hypothetical protein
MLQSGDDAMQLPRHCATNSRSSTGGKAAGVGRERSILAAGCFALAAVICTGSFVGAQTNEELEARGAFLVATSTALPPITLDDALSFVLRYGGWVYYAREPIHSNLGATFVRRFKNDRVTAASTIAYASASCSHCDGWFLAGIDVERRLSGPFGVRGTLATGLSATHANASATSLGITVPMYARSGELSASIQPGLAIAGVTTSAEKTRGARPTIGVAFSSKFGRFSAGVGVQAVVLRSSAPVVGVTFAW